jgi:hypothetical protein
MTYKPVEFDKRKLKATGLYAPKNSDNPVRNDLMMRWCIQSAAITQQIQRYLVERGAA